MVNCKNCGAPLSLNQGVCPHCGTPNPEAQEHLKKLKKLEKDYDSAKKEVVEEVRKVRSGYSLLVILALLLLANLVLVPLHSASYEIAEKIIASRMSEQEIVAKMDELLEKGEYIELKVFTDKFQLSYSRYGDYMFVASLAESYSRVLESVNNYYYGTDNYDDPLVRIAQRIVDFKEDYKYAVRREMSGEKAAAVDTMNGEVDRVLKVFLNLREEEIAQVDQMSSSALLILISERLNNEE